MSGSGWTRRGMRRRKRGLACRGDAHVDGQRCRVPGTHVLIDAVCGFSGQIHPSPFMPELQSLDQPCGSQELFVIHPGVGRIVYPFKRITLLSPVPITNQKGSVGCLLASSCTERVLGPQI